MNIGIDARWIGAAGVGRYISNVIAELERIDQTNRYSVYFVHGEAGRRFLNDRWQSRVFPDRRVVGQVQLRLDPAWRGLDVFWATNQFVPRACGRRVFKVLTVHDAVWKLFPETMAHENLQVHEKHFSGSVHRADHVIAVSNATRQFLIESMDVPAEKVSVVYHGVDVSFAPHEKKTSARYIADKYGISEDYICTLGTIEPRKGHTTLVRAIKILHDRGALTHQLAIAGGPGWNNEQIYRSVADCGLSEREVKFLGKVPDDDLPKLYSGAALFAYASLYEGFGLPLIEAMACGTPVVSSDAPAMPEVAGGAAILVPGGNPEAFADAVSSILGNPGLRRQWVEKGLRRAADFRWTDAARQILAILEAGGKKPTALAATQSRS